MEKDGTCEYCQLNGLKRKRLEDEETGKIEGVVSLYGNFYVCCECGCSNYLKIKYCPMCGRKLDVYR